MLVAALWWLARREARVTGAPGTGTPRSLVTAVAVLAVVAALASAVQVLRVGDSGAKSVWEDAGGSLSAR